MISNRKRKGYKLGDWPRLDRRHKGDELGKWITNIYEPDRYDSRPYHSSSSISDKKESDKAWCAYINRIEKLIIGPPKASKEYTTEQLQKMNLTTRQQS